MILESKFKRETTKEIKKLFPKCLILKNDPSYVYGIPDMLILFENHWAMLEFKRESGASRQSNQDFYIDLCDKMSYASFIYPENKEQVLHELQQAFKPVRITRISRSKQIPLDKL